MLKRKIDLHIHSNASDGIYPSRDLVDRAIKLKVKAFAIADHDNVRGIKEALDYSIGKDIEIIPAIEFTADAQGLAKEIHIVGLFIDIENKYLKKAILSQEEERKRHINKIIKKLEKLGYNVSLEEAEKEAGNPIFGRPAIAKVILKKYPKFKDRKQVFDELLGKDGKAFFESNSLKIKSIIKVIHQAGGLAVLAHPGYTEQPKKVIEVFAKFGGDGVEVDSPYTVFGDKAQNLRDTLRKYAKENNLFVSGGTDFHEYQDDIDIGSFGVSEEEFHIIKERLKKWEKN
jgi:predicted metal-dependent phosphoesterase TrpH